MINNPEVRDHLTIIRRWHPTHLRELWNECMDKAKQKYKRQGNREKLALKLILNNLMNEGDQRIDNLDATVKRYSKHIRQCIDHSLADYDNLISKDVLTVDDVALLEALKQEDYHNIFVGTPTAITNIEDYYRHAGEKINTLINKYHVRALELMNATAKTIEEHPADSWSYPNGLRKWNAEDIEQRIEQAITDSVPNREAYQQAHKARSVAEFLVEVQAKESDEYLTQLIDGFITTHNISFDNLSNNARRKLQPMLQKAIPTIAESITDPNAVVYLRGYANGKWRTAKRLNCEEFEAWMNNMFVNPDGGFIIRYDDEVHYVLTDGDRDYTPPAYAFERLFIGIMSGGHKGGG